MPNPVDPLGPARQTGPTYGDLHETLLIMLRGASRDDRLGCRAMVAGNYLAPFFRIELCGDFGRAHQVAEKHGQMPPLATFRHRYGCVNSSSGGRYGSTYCGSAFTTEAFVQLDLCAAFWT